MKTFNNTKISCITTLLGVILVSSCGNHAEKSAQNDSVNTEAVSGRDSARVSGTDCNVQISGINFTKSINGADTLASVDSKGKVQFSVGEKKDYFSDPNGKLSNTSAPILLSKVDNTKPFTLTAKVTPGFTEKGMYSAGVLYLYVNDNFYQKYCFEQDERGKHRMVTVRTIGTSDDNNHDIVESPWVYMKITSDTQTVASYYSMDKKNWYMVRLYQNNYPKELWVGLSSQSPVDKGMVSDFEEVTLTQESVKDLRMGN
ncbi:DUF1349 domain-containing protein [Pedobacter antarcticus]|uniref:DUF1349 domain-containing protein n=1 Tax=Pedobacter antarcticus TaxID=34086 RepID=UPI00088FCF28|nr:DUF1349 domain-containing protein [Pedobacter antarcticus]SDL37426.1 hypothetical protein SAMN04488084_10181 [Pedobacter antarcticus]